MFNFSFNPKEILIITIEAKFTKDFYFIKAENIEAIIIINCIIDPLTIINF